MTDNDSGAPLPPIEPDPAPDTVPTPVPTADQPDPVTTSQATEPHVTTASGKPDVGRRVLAYVIDWVVAMVIFAILSPLSGPLASLVGAAYLLLRDGFEFDFMRGRSLGKKLMNLTVTRTSSGVMDLATSARRNWPLALSMLPLGLLWLIIAPIALAIGLYEAYLVFTSEDGRRWGDRMAGTQVVETTA